jgi:hypothetical protein
MFMHFAECVKCVCMCTVVPKKCIRNLIQVIYCHFQSWTEMLCTVCSVIFKEMVLVTWTNMNSNATLSNCRPVKQNGGGTVAVRATQDNFQVDTIGFWRWCITHRDIGFSDFVHRPDFSQIMKKHNVSETGSVSVLRWGKTPTLLGPLERANLNHSFTLSSF